jgi:hypothetical protein
MGQLTINTGSADNDGLGDALRLAFQKTNLNFGELYMPKARLVASYQAGTYQMPFGFGTIPLEAASVDTENGYANSRYTVKKTGFYLIIGKVRLKDATTASQSYSVGMDIGNVEDTPEMQWFTTSDVAANGSRRNGALNIRIMQLTVGDILRLYSYTDFSPILQAAALSVLQVA